VRGNRRRDKQCCTGLRAAGATRNRKALVGALGAVDPDEHGGGLPRLTPSANPLIVRADAFTPSDLRHRYREQDLPVEHIGIATIDDPFTPAGYLDGEGNLGAEARLAPAQPGHKKHRRAKKAPRQRSRYMPRFARLRIISPPPSKPAQLKPRPRPRSANRSLGSTGC
jgi:hypothetical protein